MFSLQTFRSNMYNYLLKRLETSSFNSNNNENLSIDSNGVISRSYNKYSVLKFYPNDDYSIHSSSLWLNYNYVRSYIRMYSCFSLYKNNVEDINYIGLCSSISLDMDIKNIIRCYKRPFTRLVSIKEGFLVKSENRLLESVRELSNIMSENQSLDELQYICSKIAAIFLTKYNSLLTNSNVEALSIYLVPSKKRFYITTITLNCIDVCNCNKKTYEQITNYLSHSLKDYKDPEGYTYNPFVVNYILPLNLDNSLEQAVILSDILYS